MNLADLRKPFPPDRISWRVGSTNHDKTKGMALAYIDARDVQDRLDAVCGVESWQCRYLPMPGTKTVCEIGIRILSSDPNQPAEWVWKSDGAGDSDIEAEKGALSDAFKRAAVRWGVGRYLYDLDSPWVALEAAGKSFKIAGHEYARLEALLSKTVSKPAPDQDVEDGVRNWGNQRRAEIDEAKALPDLYAWKETHDVALSRLHAKHPSAWNSLMQYYQAKFEALSKRQ
jgi:hypothetical protein